MVQVFKTDVQNPAWVEKIIRTIQDIYPCLKVNFDLEDEDRILRVEGNYCITTDIISCLKEYGYTCIYLPMDPQ